MRRHAACQLDDIPDGTTKGLRVAGRDVLLVRKGTSVYAIRDRCPHQGGQLSLGILSASRVMDGCGQYHLVKSGTVIRCPWHNWEFDVTQGSCLDPSVNSKVATYQTEIDEGEVFLLM